MGTVVAMVKEVTLSTERRGKRLGFRRAPRALRLKKL